LVGGDDFIHQADTQCFLGVDVVADQTIA